VVLVEVDSEVELELVDEVVDVVVVEDVELAPLPTGVLMLDALGDAVEFVDFVAHDADPEPEACDIESEPTEMDCVPEVEDCADDCC